MGKKCRKRERAFEGGLSNLDGQDDLDGSVAESTTDALMNHLVLKHTFEYVDVQNLLSFSLVNKLWCTTARGILRTKRRCLACIPGVNPCQELLRLNKTLATCHENPFSGLGIRTCPPPKKSREEVLYVGGDYAQEYFTSSSSEEEDEDEENISSDGSFHPSEDSEELSEEEDLTSDESTSSLEFSESMDSGQQLGHKCFKGDIAKRYSLILEKLTYRHFEIHWDRNSACPAVALISKIFREKGEILSELKITRYPFAIPVLGTYLGMEKNWLPKLKVLDWGSCVPSMEKATKCDLIDAAPQLQRQLGLNRYHELDYFINKGRVAVMQHYDFFYPSSIASNHAQHLENETLMRFGMLSPKLTKFLFTGLFLHEASANETRKLIRDFLTNLLDSVSGSLEEIQMDQIHFILFLLSNNCLSQPLSLLKKFNMGLSNNVDRRMGFPTLERFNWGSWFPCLKTVQFCISPHNEDYLAMEELRRQQQTVSFSCLSVTQIVFLQRCQADYTTVFNFESLGYLSNLFPNVKEVSFVGVTRMDKILKFLWVSWPLMESITLTLVKISAVAHNLDSIFCGITKEQASVYQSQPVRSLEKLDFKPGQPSIQSLTQLKKLRIELVHRQRCHRIRTNDSQRFFLTHVTPVLAFASMPGLTVEVITNVCQRKSVPCGFTFKHLAPFIKITDVKVKCQPLK